MWYNPAAFAVPANGSYGNFRRNSIYGPGGDNWNMSLFKNFNFTENTRIQLRFEAYNVFNHTQWGTINNDLNAPTPGTSFAGANAGASGQITSARDLAILARALIREFPDYSFYWHVPAIKFGRRIVRNYNPLLGRYPGADGMKTGFICASGFNLVATATRNNKHLIAVVLGAPSGAARAG